MRILLVTSMVPDAEGVGAIPKLLQAELAGLRENHEVTLVAPFGEDPGQAEAAALLSASDLDAHLIDRRRSPDAARRWIVRAGLAATWARRGWPWRVVLGVGGVQEAIDRLAQTRRFDVIAVEDNPMSVLRFPAGVPAVLTEHEAVRAPASDWRSSRISELPIRAVKEADWRRWDSFLPRAWRRFELLQVFTEGDAAEVRGRAPDLATRVRVNPYGMVLPQAADPALEAPGTILFTGTFSHLPNRDAARWLAGEIVPILGQRNPQVQLQIVGHDPPPEVRQLAGPNVEVVANAESVEPYLEAAAVVIAPVRTGGGMRMKVLEALARGKATVTTSRGAEGFRFFEPEPPMSIAEDSAGIAAATAELLDDEPRRRELGRRAREFAERHYSPSPWAARLEVVYEEARSEASSSDFRAG